MTDQSSILKQNIQLFKKSIDHLERSYKTVLSFIDKDNLSDDEYMMLEALGARFSRTVDFFTKQVLRSLDFLEYGEAGTLLDVINNAEKREILDTNHHLREMKDIRNRIAHEYIPESLVEIYRTIVEYTPMLLSYSERTINYSQRFLCV